MENKNLSVPEAEQSVLGSVLIDGKSIKDIADTLKPEHFYSKENRIIYEACIKLYKHKKPIDFVTVGAELTKTNSMVKAGGTEYLSELVDITPTSVNLKQYAQEVIETAEKRTLNNILYHGVESLTEGKKPLNDILKDVKKRIDTIAVLPLLDKPISTSELLEEYYKTLGNGTKNLIGIETGIEKLDKATLGLSGISILGGIAGKGKTSLALQLAFEVCRKGTPTLFYSLEMPKRAIYTKILNRLARVKYSDILLKGKPYLSDTDTEKNVLNETIDTKNLLSKEQIKNLQEAKQQVSEVGKTLYIMDKTDGIATTDKLERQISLIQGEQGSKQLFVVIDHLQIFPIEQYTDLKDKVDKLLAEFKGISERTGATMLLISQKNRAGYYSSGLEALMGSASIEYTADMVMFLETEQEKEARKQKQKGGDLIDSFDYLKQEIDNNAPIPIDLVIAKNRYNPPKTIPLVFDGEYSTFTEREIR